MNKPVQHLIERIRQRRLKRWLLWCANFTHGKDHCCQVGMQYASMQRTDAAGVTGLPCTNGGSCGSVECPLFEPRPLEQWKEQQRDQEEQTRRAVQSRSTCCDAPLDTRQVIQEGSFKGHGPRFCSQCHKLAIQA